MSQLRRIIMMVAMLTTMLLPAARLQAAADVAATGGDVSLAELHKVKKVGCSECHGSTKKLVVDDDETGINKKCIECHGTLSDLSVKDKGDIKPHGSHLGDINCTTCHSGHKQSKAY